MTEPSTTSEERVSAPDTRRLKLRITIPLAVFLMMGTLSGLLFGLHYAVTSRIVRDFARVLLDPVAAVVTERARDFLHEVERASEMGADLASEQNGEMEDMHRLEAYEMSILRTHSGVSYVQLGDASGRFLLVERTKTGALDTNEIRDPASRENEWHRRDPGQGVDNYREEKIQNAESYDPRLRPWYQGASGSSKVFWTEPYVHAAHHLPVITAARASRNGKIVSSATVSLEGLSSFLKTIELHGRTVNTVILESDGTVIAASEGMDIGAGDAKTLVLPKLEASKAPLLQELSRHADVRESIAKTREFSFVLEAAEGRYLGVLQPLHVGEGRTWIAVAMVPEAPYLGQIRSGFFQSAAIALVIILVFIIAAMLLSRTVVQPLHAIAEETRLIRKLSFEDRTITNSRFDEIAEITDAYKSLKRGLRAFEKYVPLKLVRTLLENGEEPVLGGRVEELTIFFSDVRGFSTFSETMSPEALAEMLGDYLQTLTNVVSTEAGTVDKFIGDAVMAFWNAPKPVEDHAYKAVVAAIACQKAVDGMKESELLYTRIGIHTGRVMVGNFGAKERMGYTVMGDSVNLAARLEGVNKEYGTKVLISETTLAQIKGRIVCRRVDRIAVKGKSQATDIYEVIGLPGAISDEMIQAAKAYDEGLEAYLQQDFQGALAKFAKASELRAGDKAVEVLIKRCQKYIAEPPPENWTGVSAMESK